MLVDALLPELAAEGGPGERREVAPAEIAGSAAIRRRRDIPAPPSAVAARASAAAGYYRHRGIMQYVLRSLR